MTDPIADFLTRIRNSAKANRKIVDIPSSKMKKRLTEILYQNGYILKYKFDKDENDREIIRIALKYDTVTKLPIIKKMRRVSRPGLRKYSGAADIPKIINNLGIAIVSTSKGVMTDKDARSQNVGGEVLCYIY